MYHQRDVTVERAHKYAFLCVFFCVFEKCAPVHVPQGVLKGVWHIRIRHMWELYNNNNNTAYYSLNFVHLSHYTLSIPFHCYGSAIASWTVTSSAAQFLASHSHMWWRASPTIYENNLFKYRNEGIFLIMFAVVWLVRLVGWLLSLWTFRTFLCGGYNISCVYFAAELREVARRTGCRVVVSRHRNMIVWRLKLSWGMRNVCSNGIRNTQSYKNTLFISMF